jgi:hypothetical protein
MYITIQMIIFIIKDFLNQKIIALQSRPTSEVIYVDHPTQ